MKRHISLLCGALMALGASASGQARMDKFIDSLLSQMTLEEKIGQLNPAATISSPATR